MAQFGSATPTRFGSAASVPTFPQTGNTYTDSAGTIVVPAGALDTWWKYRATAGAARGEVIGIGDSTMFGSGGNYSFLQRLRDRSVAAGIGDGGKGMFGNGESAGIAYDAPEVSGFVSKTGGFALNPDQYDNLDGQYWLDDGSTPGAVLVLQFRATCARLWYSVRTNAGDFTYSIDGGSAVTVHANAASGNPVQKFIYLSGLSAGTTHTLTITNLATSGNAACYVTLAPMNSTGLVWQKYATSGDTISSRFFAQAAAAPYTQSLNGFRYQESFGLTGTSLGSGTGYKGAPVDSTQPAGGTIKPVLAMTNLGFNDLSAAATGDDVMWTEYVKRFAGACADAGCGGIILSGQLPYNSNWPTWGATRYNALKNQALASGLAWVDLFYPIGGPSLSYSGGTTNPHLTKTQYQTQADYLWDNLLSLS